MADFQDLYCIPAQLALTTNYSNYLDAFSAMHVRITPQDMLGGLFDFTNCIQTNLALDNGQVEPFSLVGNVIVNMDSFDATGMSFNLTPAMLKTLLKGTLGAANLRATLASVDGNANIVIVGKGNLIVSVTP